MELYRTHGWPTLQLHRKQLFATAGEAPAIPAAGEPEPAGSSEETANIAETAKTAETATEEHSRPRPLQLWLDNLFHMLMDDIVMFSKLPRALDKPRVRVKVFACKQVTASHGMCPGSHQDGLVPLRASVHPAASQRRCSQVQAIPTRIGGAVFEEWIGSARVTGFSLRGLLAGASTTAWGSARPALACGSKRWSIFFTTTPRWEGVVGVYGLSS